MKKSHKAILGIYAVAAAGAGINFAVLKNSVKNLPVDFTVTAHTGCEKSKDNSLESISAAINAGAQITEFDLRFDGDGKAILSHDDGAENPVTLDEAFALVAVDDKLMVNVDVKTTDNIKEVYLLSEKYGITNRIFYTGIEEAKVETVKTETPAISYYLNYAPDLSKKYDDEYIASLIELVKGAGAVGLNVNYLKCSKKMVEAFRREGLKVSVWTAKEIFSMIICLNMMPDNITTRCPVLLNKLIDFLR